MLKVSEEIFGLDPKMQKALGIARNVSVTKNPIVITGEKGTGKRSLGQFIHNQSSRRDGPICIVDCSRSSKEVENEILGHRDEETGKFNRGVLESCNSGTVILSDIDGIAESFQKRLHQIFLELNDYDIDVRIIGTTSKNLSKLVGAGRFYRALYTYITGTQINLPPLRERISDIQIVAKFILDQLSTESNRNSLTLSEESLKKLMSHYWTHNISELENVLLNTIENTESNIIQVEDLAMGDKKTMNSIYDDSEDGLKLMSLKEAERLLIKKALIHTSENRTQAAKILGVSIRTLRNKINEYRNEGAHYFINLR